MNQHIGQIIDECVRLENELSFLTPLLFYMNPSWHTKKLNTPEISEEGWERLKSTMQKLGNADNVKTHFVLQERKLKTRLSVLANLLDDDGFDISRWKPQLTNDQFAWLASQKGQIKQHLQGISFTSR